MKVNKDGTVTLTKQEVDWLNDNFQGGSHMVREIKNRYEIIDNEGDACGWGVLDNNSQASTHRKFMDDFTSLSD